MLDRALIGLETAISEIAVEHIHLKMFARAIGEKNPIYFDTAAARAAGYPNVVAPPTFPIALEAYAALKGGWMDHPLPYENMLHAEQGFSYLHLIFAGDVIQVQNRVVDIYEKKGGALEFLASETSFTQKATGQVAVRTQALLVWRHG